MTLISLKCILRLTLQGKESMNDNKTNQLLWHGPLSLGYALYQNEPFHQERCNPG